MEISFELNPEENGFLDKLCHHTLWEKEMSHILLSEAVAKISSKCMDEIFFAGSIGEGLLNVSFGMQAPFDIDIMLTHKNKIATERTNVKTNRWCETLRLENSPFYPGYANLKLPSTNFDADYLYGEDYKEEINDALFSDLFACFFECNIGSISTTHGPAKVMDLKFDTLSVSLTEIVSEITSMDIVRSIRCLEWPSVANEWKERQRMNWPSFDTIKQVVKLGCDLVPTGCHGSKTDIKEWRISFVRAERHLFHSLTDVQKKVFVLLKIIFRNKAFGEDFHNKISSYVAKCSFLWISEELDGNHWKNSHCLKYLWLCLQKMKCFVEKGHCPNYFMRKCNVLHGKLTDEEKQQFCTKLNFFTRKDRFKTYVFTLPCFVNLTSTNFESFDGIEILQERVLEEFYSVALFHLLSTPSVESSIDAIGDLQELYHDFQRYVNSSSPINKLFFHRLSSFIKCNQMRLENLAIDRVHLGRHSLEKRIKNMILEANLPNETFCLGQITQIAHVFFTNTLYKEVLTIVSPVLQEIKQNPLLGIQSLQFFRFSPSVYETLDHNWQLSREPVYSITFFKLEEAILSKDLRLELFIPTVELPTRLKKYSSFHYVSIHPLVYMYYMEYKCCSHLERKKEILTAKRTQEALRNLVQFVLKYTAYEYHSLNILGCCLKEESCFEGAMKMFTRSYRNRFYKKSVLYHTALLLHKCFRDEKL